VPIFERLGSETIFPSEVIGSGWRAVADENFLRLEILNGEHTWRAAAGSPIWTDGRLLLAILANRLLVYDFLQR
jgi:hypothetical protein